jgi:uncharacterized coiled-coil protein SlyX
VGSKAALDAHLPECQYESVKGILADNEARIEALACDLAARDQEIAQLRQMVTQLAERVERTEASTEQRLGTLRGP